ncbi:MAG: MMPL family transporter [Nanoarchaeota archaeon]|nr:MMPL family transporter [Nanoarchaeota archaeon]
MIDQLAQTLARLQLKHTKLLLAIFLVFTLAVLPGIVFLPSHVEPSLERVMPSFIEELRLVNHMRTQFGSDITYVVLTANGPLYDVRDKAALEYISVLEQAFQQRELVVGTQSIASIYGTQEEYPTEVIAPDMISKGNDITVIKVITDTGADADAINELIDGIETDIEQFSALNPGFDIQITGFNVIDKLTFNVIMSDFLVITGVSMSLIALILWLFFRTGKKVLLAMSVLFAAVIWTMGIVGYLGMTITVVSMVSIAMIMGLGIDFSVHMMHTYYEYREKHSPKKSVLLTQKELMRAVFGAAATTIAGFLALLFGVLPAMQTLAIILAIGIFNTLFGAIGLMPLLLYTTDKVKEQ